MAKTTFRAAGYTFEATPTRHRGKLGVMWRGYEWVNHSKIYSGFKFLSERATRAQVAAAFGVKTS
jgi:hypothetical protein